LTPGWTQEELAAIGKAEELEIAPARADGQPALGDSDLGRDDAGTAAAIDEAYHANYQRYGARYVDAMVADAARATTFRLVPSRDDA
jgi:hypothetical protein